MEHCFGVCRGEGGDVAVGNVKKVERQQQKIPKTKFKQKGSGKGLHETRSVRRFQTHQHVCDATCWGLQMHVRERERERERKKEER